MKDGQGFCKAFRNGVDFSFGAAAGEVMEAIVRFLTSLPMAVRCGGTFLAHSVPAPNRMEAAGTEILRRPYRPEDMKRGGPLYDWTWGRAQTAEEMEALAARLECSFFMLGHKHIEGGYEWLPPRTVFLTSDTERGCVVVFPAGAPQTLDTIQPAIRPIVALRKG
jgi:hypothetical protein